MCFIIVQTHLHLQIKGLAGTMLHLWIVPKAGGVASPNETPKCRFLNVEVVPGSKLNRKDFRSTILLENPQGENLLSYDQLLSEVLCNHSNTMHCTIVGLLCYILYIIHYITYVIDYICR